MPFGYFLFKKFVYLKLIFFITFPVALIENTLPFGELLLFLLLLAGIVRNSNVPYFVRFNGCQALLLDIALIVLSFLMKIIPIPEIGSFLFVCTLAIFIFCVIKCINGIEPEIPLISDSARMQIY